MPYPHEELVRAWLDGKTIQFRENADIWLDMDGPDVATKMPHFYRSGTEYRVKPVTIRYRVALMTYGSVQRTYSVDSLEREQRAANDPTFVRWISDWTEVTL